MQYANNKSFAMYSRESYALSPAARRRRQRRRGRLLRSISVLVLIGVGATLAVVLTQGPSSQQASRPRPRPIPTRVVDRPPACSVVIALDAAVPAYQTPRSPTPVSNLQATLAGVPVSLPVINRVGRYLQVRLFGRPNGQTTWVKISSSVRLLRDPYRIVVDLGHKRLFLYHSGRIVVQAPAAIGSPATPTPLGSYFVLLLAQAPTSAYGPFVLVTSAMANGVTDWVQQNQSVIPITGPLQWAGTIGGGGGAVTTGGVAVESSDLSKFRPVPLGTPIDVVPNWTPPSLSRGHHRSPAQTATRTVVPPADRVPKSLAC